MILFQIYSCYNLGRSWNQSMCQLHILFVPLHIWESTFSGTGRNWRNYSLLSDHRVSDILLWSQLLNSSLCLYDLTIQSLGNETIHQEQTGSIPHTHESCSHLENAGSLRKASHCRLELAASNRPLLLPQHSPTSPHCWEQKGTGKLSLCRLWSTSVWSSEGSWWAQYQSHLCCTLLFLWRM